MNIEMLAVGTSPPSWIVTGFGEYQKRLPREFQLSLKEIPVAHRSRSNSIARLKQEEGERMLAAVKRDARIVALDLTGSQWSTEALATNLQQWQLGHSYLQLMIGGPDGLAKECLARADDLWSLSKLTFPHFLVRVLAAEQLYRAWSIIKGHPYHK